MRLPWMIALAASLTMNLGSQADEPPAKKKSAPAPAPAPETKVEPDAADSEAPLPEGWPGGTKPGTIEVKTYPAYRSAILRVKEGSPKAMGALFFPLFFHIQRKGIAMTTPVVMTYDPKSIEKPDARGDVSMEFLYRTPTQGEAGPGLGAVKVEDHPAATFVCLGVQGEPTDVKVAEAVEKLKTWIDAHKDEWLIDGPPRQLGYHGPATPRKRKLGEIQIPVKAAKPKS